VFSSVVQSATVTTSPTAVFSVSGLVSPKDQVITNAGTAEIYLSGTSSAATSGFPVPAGAQVMVTSAAVNLWAVTASGSSAASGSLATGNVVIALQDALMVQCPVDTSAPQVFDLYQYLGTAQSEEPLNVLGPAGSPAVLTWPQFPVIQAGGPAVNPAGQLGNFVLVNSGTDPVYVGLAGVTTLTGVPVQPSRRLVLLNAPPPSAVYAVCAAGQSSSVITGLVSVPAVF